MATPFDFVPAYSRDGTKFLFMRSDGPMPTSGPAMLSLMVANADGSGLRALSEPVTELSWFDWSPSGSQIAYIHDFGSLTVVNRGRLRIQDIGPRSASTFCDLAAARRLRDPVQGRAIKDKRPSAGDLCHQARRDRPSPHLDEAAEQRLRLHGPDRRARWLAGQLCALHVERDAIQS